MTIDRAERAQRLQKIAIEMDAIVRDLYPKWMRLAHLREESRSIITELEADESPRT